VRVVRALRARERDRRLALARDLDDDERAERLGPVEGRKMARCFTGCPV
jgi:hypothetical protein